MTFGNATCVDALAGVVCYGVFFNYHGPGDNHPAVEDCSAPENFDPDITGIGVVISFCASAIICQIASVTASVLDNIASRRTSVLPTRWQPRNISDRLRARCIFYRRILERLILNLADQQLVTGFALLIGAWVKLHSNPVLRNGWQVYETYFSRLPNLWLPNAQFSLVVYLAMASSSSHLASVLVSREYMEDHRAQARLRILLIIIFAMFLAVTIAFASGMTYYFIWIIDSLFNLALKPRELQQRSTYTAILSVSMAIPIVLTLSICWLCALQLTPHLKERVQKKLRSFFLKPLKQWFKLSKIWHYGLMRLAPQRWREPLTKFVKRCFWLLVVGHEFEVFVLQNILAILSIIWIALQRLATPPAYLSDVDASYDDHSEYSSLCSLHNVAGRNQWASFGQLLPMILLILPLLSAYGAFIEESDKKRVSEYASVPGWEWSPAVPERKKTSRRPTFRDESELSLLNSQGQRHESSGTINSAFTRAHYSRHESFNSLSSPPPTGPYVYGDGPSPVPIQSAFSPELNNARSQGGYFGWPAGTSTGVDEQQYPYAPDSLRR